MRYTAVLTLIFSTICCYAETIYVDDDGPADFNNIQAAIDFSEDGDIIIVQPGYYEGEERSFYSDTVKIVDFKGKNITLTSTNPSSFDTVSSTVLNATIIFKGTEDPNYTLSGFKIISDTVLNGIMGTDITQGYASSPRTKATIANCIIQRAIWNENIYSCDGLIKNCLIADNYNGTPLASMDPVISNCHGKISGCTLARNFCGEVIDIGPDSGHLTIENCIVYGNPSGRSIWVPENCSASISYCNIENGIEGVYGTGSVSWGPGNIDVDPYFVREGFYDTNDGDYHLQSQAGRWDANSQSWVIDSNTSPCIDAGDWMSPVGFEPFPNGGRVNMGAYGGTAEASKSYFGEPLCETIIAGDINGDCKVDFVDFVIMSTHWLEGAGQK